MPGDVRTWLLRALTATLVVAVLLMLPLAWPEARDRPYEALVWLAALLVANGFCLSVLGPRLNVSLSAPLVAATAVLFDPPLAAVLNAFGFWAPRELRGDAPLLMSLFNRAQNGVSAGVAAVAVGLAPFALLGSTMLAVLVYALANTTLVAAGILLRWTKSSRAAVGQAAAPFPRFAIDFAITSFLALVVVVAYDSLGLGAIALLVPPLWLAWSAMRSAREAEDRAEELAGRVRELETLHDTTRDLLTARTPDQAAAIGQAAIGRVLERDDVDVAIDPAEQDERPRVPVQGAEPATVLIPPDVDERSLAVVESVAGILGLALTRQRLEEELAEVQRARADLAAEILEQGVRERSRLASHLHDDVLPLLSGAQMAADNTRSALAAGSNGQADRLAADAGDAIHAGISRLREMLDAVQRQIIVPGGLHDGLAAALDELKLKGGVDSRFHWPDDVPELPFAVEILLLDVARGCLANILEHASAHTAEVAVCADECSVRLDVSDDGYGFDPREVAEGHHGLALMRQRTKLARGSFAVHSRPGEGTRVRVEVPR